MIIFMHTPAARSFIKTLILSIAAVAAVVGVFLFMTTRISGGIDARATIVPEIYRMSEERVLGRGGGLLLASRQDDLERINAFFVDRARPLDFVESLQRAARMTGNFAEFTVDERASSGGDLLFRASVEGTGGSVMRYIQALEFLPYIVLMEEVNFEKIPAESRRPRVGFPAPEARFSVTLRVKTAHMP